MPRKSRVAAIQMASSPNVSANLLEARRLIQEAVDESGANLVVLPENFAFMGDQDRDLLDPFQGKETAGWLAARGHGSKASRGGAVGSEGVVPGGKGVEVAGVG